MKSCNCVVRVSCDDGVSLLVCGLGEARYISNSE